MALSLTIAKGIVIGVNFIFIIVGIILIAIGAQGIDKSDELEKDGGDLVADLPVKEAVIFVVVVGVAIIIISMCGLVGAWKRYRKALTFYALFLCVVSVIELALGIGLVAVGAGSQVDSFVEDKWYADLQVVYPQGCSTRPSITNGCKAVQVQDWLTCCGYNTPTDSLADIACPFTSPPSCREEILSYLEEFFVPVGIACIVLGIVQLISMTASCVILCRSKAMDRELGDEDWF